MTELSPCETFTPDAVDVYVGLRMREARKAKGMSQETLATALGITFQQVQKYERAANRVSASRLYRAAAVLDVDVSWFFAEMPEDFKGSEPPSYVTGWLQTNAGQEWLRAGEALPQDQFTAMLALARTMS
jgi:transcriptional regulator with XRE-family HTH domain